MNTVCVCLAIHLSVWGTENDFLNKTKKVLAIKEKLIHMTSSKWKTFVHQKTTQRSKKDKLQPREGISGIDNQPRASVIIKRIHKKFKNYKQPNRRMSNKHYQAFSQKQKHLQLITYEEMLGLSSKQEIGNQGHEISFYVRSVEK